MFRRGQALVIVLLVLAVALTTGLAIISRSVIDVGVSTSQQESARALSAAEAGIEAKLGGTLAGDSGTVGTGKTGGSYTVSSTSAGAAKFISFPESLRSGEVVSLFLTDYNTDGTIVLPLSGTFSGRIDACWGNPDAGGEVPAFEAELYYWDGSVYAVKRLAYDPAGRSNGFATSGISAPPSGSSACPTDHPYQYSVSWSPVTSAFGLSATDKPVLMRLRLWYNSSSHYLAVGSDTNFPVQGTIVTSSGTAGTSSRKVQVFQRYPDPFPLFDMAVFSGDSLTK